MGLFDLTMENSTLASQPWKNRQTYWSSFEFYPEWRGGRFDIFRGVAHHARQWWTRTDVVVRTFKTAGATHKDWDPYCRCSNEAKKVAQHFNKHLTSLGIPVMVQFSVPALVVMDNISQIMHVTRMLMRFDKRFGEDEVVAFEELLEGNFTTFVDEMGHVVGNGSEILEALCHFSYHHSDGEYILTNLKGVKNGRDHEEKPNTFCLTTPTVHSKNMSYGQGDKGQSGIQEFFKAHHCSAVCQNFRLPGTDPVVPPFNPAAPAMNHAGLVLPPSYEESESHKNRVGS